MIMDDICVYFLNICYALRDTRYIPNARNVFNKKKHKHKRGDPLIPNLKGNKLTM